MLKRLFMNFKKGMMMELELMIRLRPKLKARLGAALIMIMTSGLMTGYLTFRPYLDPAKRGVLILLLASISIMLITPFLMLGLVKRFRSKFLVAYLTTFTLAGAYLGGFVEFDFIANEPDPVVTDLFWITVALLGAGTWLLESLLYKVSNEKAVMEAEIKVAQGIQTMLLPCVDRKADRFVVYGRSRQAHEVGGDYFDVVDLPDKRVAVAIGDVSGHNVAAGLLMAITKAAVRTELNYLDNPNAMGISLNRTLCDHSEKNMFVSFMCGFFDFGNSRLVLLNAGHLPLLHFRASDKIVDRHLPKGMALGITPSAFFGVAEINFQPGDRFLFYTDGLEEAGSSRGKLFGLEPVIRLFGEHDEPQNFYQALDRELARFGTDGTPDDDITMVMINCC